MILARVTGAFSGVPFVLALLACQPRQETEPLGAVEAEETGPSSPGEQLEQISLALEEVKTQLSDEGEYNCCIQPTCNWCALHEGECECFTNVQAEEEVCPGCGLGWHNGKGVVDGVDASEVKWALTHEHGSGEH